MLAGKKKSVYLYRVVLLYAYTFSARWLTFTAKGTLVYTWSVAKGLKYLKSGVWWDLFDEIDLTGQPILDRIYIYICIYRPEDAGRRIYGKIDDTDFFFFFKTIVRFFFASFLYTLLSFFTLLRARSLIFYNPSNIATTNVSQGARLKR